MCLSYKTKECRYYHQGNYCHWGRKCKFYHDHSERRFSVPVAIVYKFEDVHVMGVGMSYNEALSNLICFISEKKEENNEFWSKVQHLVTTSDPDSYDFCKAMII